MANTHLDQYLNDYVNLTVPPRFAVMLSGAWGSGKTHYLNMLRDRLQKDGRKVIFVSLYGLQNTKEIDEQIFTVLHPALSNPKLKLAAKVIGGMLKAAVKIDIESIGEFSVNAQTPTISLPDYLSVGDQHVFIFDDFERCDIPVKTLLGYLNFYVEQSGFKVLIAANETQIEDKVTYGVWKEKIVGATFCVEADFENAIQSFSAEILPTELSLLISKNLKLIKQLFTESGYRNLRSLRSAMLELQRLYAALPDRVQKSDEFFSDLLSYYLPIAFEVKAGSLVPEQLTEWLDDWIKFLIRDSNPDVTSHVEKLWLKYKNLELNLLGNQASDFWLLFFRDGYVDKQKLLDLAESHPALLEPETPRWKRLWWWWRSNQKDFDENLKFVREELLHKTHKDIYVVMHIFGTFISLSEKKLFNKTTTKIVLNNAKKYIRSLSREEKFFNSEQVFRDLDFSHGQDGLGYPRESPNFQELVSFVREFAEHHRIEAKLQIAKNLESMLAADRQKFSQMLADLNGDCGRFPVFSLFKASRFIKLTKSYEKPSDWDDISWGLKERFKYANAETYDKFLPELPFFEELDKLLLNELRLRSGKLISIGIQDFKEGALATAIEKLKMRHSQLMQSNQSKAVP